MANDSIHDEDTDLSKEVNQRVRAKKDCVCFWIKSASVTGDDRSKFYELPNDLQVRELVAILRKKVFYKEVELSGISKTNPSIRRWVMKIISIYPTLEYDNVEDLLNAYRFNLKGRSKEQGKYIVAAVLQKNNLILVHSKTTSVITIKDLDLQAARALLSPEHILRADLIQKKRSKFYLSAYEYNRSFSRGHAEFWDIEESLITWDTISEIQLSVELLESEDIIQIPVTMDQIEQLYRGRYLVHGSYRKGSIEGKVVRVRIGRTHLSFNQFWESYLHQREKIQSYAAWFDKTIQPGVLDAFANDNIGKYWYDENLECVMERKGDDLEEVLKKENPTYVLCFFTKTYPGIRPTLKLVSTIHDSIFHAKHLDILHVGVRPYLEPLTLGSLYIHNEIQLSDDALLFATRIQETMISCKDIKTQLLMKLVYCSFLKYVIDVPHFPVIFDFLHEYIKPKLEQEFLKGKMIDYEGELEFKSKDHFRSKVGPFVEMELVPRVQSYLSDSILSRICIIYGIEDGGVIEPISNLKSDQVSDIQEKSNKILHNKGIQIDVHAISVTTGKLLVVFLIPEY